MFAYHIPVVRCPKKTISSASIFPIFIVNTQQRDKKCARVRVCVELYCAENGQRRRAYTAYELPAAVTNTYTVHAQRWKYTTLFFNARCGGIDACIVILRITYTLVFIPPALLFTSEHLHDGVIALWRQHILGIYFSPFAGTQAAINS